MLEKKKFGIYIHIPYCLQRCLYCDFATYEKSQIFPAQEYTQLLLEEMRQKSKYFLPQDVDTLYFGGGTPSLLEPELLAQMLDELKSLGFLLGPQSEVTIEINPATVSSDNLMAYKHMGINRYSVGAQTFKNSLLKKIGREHNAEQSLETLALLKSHTANFNFDILFALPHQSLADLQSDLDLALCQGAQHISPYCLTVPKSHVLTPGRAPEEEQVQMFEIIRNSLLKEGFHQYEISNFSLPGFESKHNLLYWTDQEYWGLGLSAHSYSKAGAWGQRFWNLNQINEYKKQILENRGRTQGSPQDLPEGQTESLKLNQSLTDFCHTSLRLAEGLSEVRLMQKFPPKTLPLVQKRLEKLIQRGLVFQVDHHWRLTTAGVLISNIVFEEMTFLSSDLPALPH